MKLDDWEMRAAFAAEDWPKVIAIMESTFSINLAGRSTVIHRGIAIHPEIVVFMPETGKEYIWSARFGFSSLPIGMPLGEEIQIFPGAH